METLESSRVCRLCGKQSGISINIFDENENHVRKINAMLPIMVHEMDLLPKHMCHRCSYKLEEFHKFYVDCLKTDTALKNQLSWMRKERSKEKIGVPMVHIENTRIKTEPLEHSDVYQLEPIVENVNYINSMKSMTFPTNGIHDGLTYTTFSRCRYCCDNKNQSDRRKTKRVQLCRNYEGKRISKHNKITENLRKNTTATVVKDTTTNAIGDIKRNVFTHRLVRDSQNSLLRTVDTVKNIQSVPVTTVTTTKDVSLTTRDYHPHDRLATIPSNPSSTIVRNLRPRKDLMNYALTIKSPKRLNIPDTSTRDKSTVVNTKTTSSSISSNFKIARRIKIEKIDKFDERSLRPRKTTVYYHGSTRQMNVSKAHYEQKCPRSDKVKRESANEGKLKNITIAIKRETNKLSVIKPPAKIKILPAAETDGNTRNNNVMNYFKSCQSQLENQLQLTERKSTSNIIRNKLAKSKRLDRISAANYSPKSLRSQDIHLRNGKRYDYGGWPLKRLQKKRLMDTIKRNTQTRKIPGMLKLVESMKHYCDMCNTSFMNKELFRLHACDFE